MIIIEKHVRIPATRRMSRNSYDIGKMEVGDSFKMPIDEATRKNLRTSVKVWKNRHQGWNYLIDLDDDGVLRCWRTA